MFLGMTFLVKSLLTSGSNPNVQTILSGSESVYRQTPMHLAVESGSVDVVKVMLESSMEIHLNVKNSEEETPLTLALAKSHSQIAELLLNGKKYVISVKLHLLILRFIDFSACLQFLLEKFALMRRYSFLIGSGNLVMLSAHYQNVNVDNYLCTNGSQGYKCALHSSIFIIRPIA